MRSGYRSIFLALLAALALGLAACGSEDGPRIGGSTETDEETTTTTATEGGEGEGGETVEVITADPPAVLPEGWETESNTTAGFTVGVPPDWKFRNTDDGAGSVIRSPDDLAVMSITADRTEGALELDLEEFATKSAEALGSDVVGKDRFDDLEANPPASFDHNYGGVGVTAVGKSKRSGVRERLWVVVIRREDSAAFVVITRRNDETKSEIADRETIRKIMRTIRDVPPS